MPVALAAIVSGCGAAAPVEDTAAVEDEGHFPAEMPMVTYYDPVPDGPLGPAIHEDAVDREVAEMIP